MYAFIESSLHKKISGMFTGEKTAAVEAAESGNLQFFKDLAPAEILRVRGTEDEDGRSTLHAAAAAGNTDVSNKTKNI